MNRPTRREFVEWSAAATALGWSLAPGRLTGADDPGLAASGLRLAPFRFDVTPPQGHSLCGGWIQSVVGVDDSLEAIGFVLLGFGQPVVICAVDWTGLLNDAHIQWRRALAEAAGTSAERVAVQCVHQHNAPFACLEAERIVAQQKDLPHIVDLDFFHDCLDRGRAAVVRGLEHARAVTHVACGQAKAQQVASNRRIARSADGRVTASRSSSCDDASLRAMPEGRIDPWLKTVSFFDGPSKIAACHYYATHPMSYYGDGRVSSDFVGLARKQRQREEPDCLHVYFTGCAGDVAAGKYNDGSKENRGVLAQRIYDAIVRSETAAQAAPIEQVAWRTAEVLPPPRTDLSADALLSQISDKQQQIVNRNRPSYMLSWLRRVEAKVPIVLSSLRVNEISLLHLPAECFVEYQLRSQQFAPSRFVATAAYGDGGPWYIPVREEYACGGYEVGVAFCDPEVDPILSDVIRSLLVA